jgi:Fe-S-cluster containining protein
MAQDEAARIAGLVAALESDPGYATGRRAFPRTLERADATLIAERLSDAVDEGAARRAEKGAAQGMHLACAPGCSACCEQLIMVWLPEALRAAEHLARPENAAAREAFLAAYPAWRERMGDAPERVAELTARGQVEAQREALIGVWKQRILCAFNHRGLCGIYEARPNICRAHHALETSDRCRADTPVPPSTLAFVPLDDFLRRAGRLNSAMHHALGGARGRTVALCDAVYRHLTKTP